MAGTDLVWPGIYIWRDGRGNLALCASEKIRGDAAVFYQACLSVNLPIQQVTEPADWERALKFVPPQVWWVDALLGTGSREAPRGNIAAAVRFLRDQAKRDLIWAVDIPTGLDADSGHPLTRYFVCGRIIL